MNAPKQVSGVWLGLLCLAVASAASAQSQYGPNGPYGSNPRVPAGSGSQQGNPNGGVLPLPPVDPFAATPQALLERDFLYMRATGGNVRNPPGSSLTPPTSVTGRYRYYPGNGGGYGYYPGYPAPVYGYYYSTVSPFGAPGPFGQVPQYYGGAVVRQEVVIIREAPGNAPATQTPGQSGKGGGAGDGGEPRATNPAPQADRSAKDDFYLNGRTGTETISDALDDIRKAWLNGDHERLRSRFRTDGQVGVYPRGEYRYSVPAREFAGMLKDAMARIDTLAFELDRPKSEETGRAFVTGKHTFLDAAQKKQETFISYMLERTDGKWKITEAGSSDSPILHHVR